MSTKNNPDPDEAEPNEELARDPVAPSLVRAWAYLRAGMLTEAQLALVDGQRVLAASGKERLKYGGERFMDAMEIAAKMEQGCPNFLHPSRVGSKPATFQPRRHTTMAEKRDDGGTAYPTYREAEFDSGAHCLVEHTPGMTLRDWFAAHALTGLFAMEANPRIGDSVEPFTAGKHESDCARTAYALADAMIAERNRQ
jgi:hypothetical protein